MIGPEDIQETPKKNYTPMIILGIAAVLLLVVGFISYKDYVNANADRKVADSNERIRNLEEKLARMSGAQPSLDTIPNVATPKPATDPEIEELRRQLDAMKRQSDMILAETKQTKLKTEENSMKMERVLSGGPGDPRNSRLGTIPPGIRDDLTVPDYIRDSVATPPGGYRSERAQAALTELQRKVKNAPAIGNIISYNEEWNLITLDAGSSNGVATKQRYSVRRGTELLGTVKIFETFPSQSNANVVSKNREFDGALKPKVGDEIISFDPF